VGSLKPNDLGLFDVHGNVWMWCQEEYKNYPQGRGEKVIEDNECRLSINIKDERVFRGGSFLYQAVFLRCAYRSRMVPPYNNTNMGFRAARTFTP
jgi:formylglycine-generating enzyme required for sulfatase activity